MYLVRHLALEVHGQFHHVVVGGAGEEDLSGVELVERTAHRPHIDTIVIRLPDDCDRQKQDT